MRNNLTDEEGRSDAIKNIADCLHELFMATATVNPQLEKQLAQLLKSGRQSLGSLNYDLIKSLTTEVFWGAILFNGNITKSAEILNFAKKYFQSVLNPCKDDAHIFHCIAFYVQAESKIEIIASGMGSMLEHREKLLAFPDPLKESVISIACDGFTFGDKEATLKFIDIINLHLDLLTELPVETRDR